MHNICTWYQCVAKLLRRTQLFQYFFSISGEKQRSIHDISKILSPVRTHDRLNKLLEKTQHVPMAQDIMICRKYGSKIVFNRSTAAILSKRFSLTDRTFRKFATAFRDGTMLNSEGGRPPTFDDISCKSIREGSAKELKLDTPDFLKLMKKEAGLTPSRRGKSIYQFRAPCRHTLFRTEKRLCIGSGIAVETTNARAVATRSVWNAVPFATLNIAMVP